MVPRRHSGILTCVLLAVVCCSSTAGLAAVLQPQEVEASKLRALLVGRELPFESTWLKLSGDGKLSGNAMNTSLRGSWQVKGDSLLLKVDKSFIYPDRPGWIELGIEITYSGARLLEGDLIYFGRGVTETSYRGVEDGKLSKRELAQLERKLRGEATDHDIIFELGDKGGVERRLGLQLIAGSDDQELRERVSAVLEQVARKYHLVVVDGGRARNSRERTEVHVHDPGLGASEAEERHVPWTLQLALLAMDPGTDPEMKTWRKRGYVATVITGSAGAAPNQASVGKVIALVEGAKGPIDVELGAQAIAGLVDRGLDLGKGLSSKSPRVRRIVSAGIALRPAKAAPYRQTLVKALDTDDLSGLVGTVEALAGLGHELEPEIVAKVATGLDDLELMEAAARALAAVGPAAIDPAIDAIVGLHFNINHKQRLQEQAIAGVATMGEVAVEPLTKIVEKWGGDASRKDVAIRWLGHAGPAAAPKLCKWLEATSSPTEKVKLIRALEVLARKHRTSHAKITPALEKASMHKDARVAKEAGEALKVVSGQ